MKMKGTKNNDGGGKGFNLHKMQKFEDEKEEEYNDHNRAGVDFTSPEKGKNQQSKFSIIEEEKEEPVLKQNSSFQGEDPI